MSTHKCWMNGWIGKFVCSTSMRHPSQRCALCISCWQSIRSNIYLWNSMWFLCDVWLHFVQSEWYQNLCDVYDRYITDSIYAAFQQWNSESSSEQIQSSGLMLWLQSMAQSAVNIWNSLWTCGNCVGHVCKWGVGSEPCCVLSEANSHIVASIFVITNHTTLVILHSIKHYSQLTTSPFGQATSSKTENVCEFWSMKFCDLLAWLRHHVARAATAKWIACHSVPKHLKIKYWCIHDRFHYRLCGPFRIVHRLQLPPLRVIAWARHLTHSSSVPIQHLHQILHFRQLLVELPGASSLKVSLQAMLLRAWNPWNLEAIFHNSHFHLLHNKFSACFFKICSLLRPGVTSLSLTPLLFIESP